MGYAIVGKMQRDKGARVERLILKKMTDKGISCERVPLSGAVNYQNNRSDIDIYTGNHHFKAEVKGRKLATWKTMEKWLGDSDILILKANNEEPVVAMPFDILTRLLQLGQTENIRKFKTIQRVKTFACNHFKVTLTRLEGNQQSIVLNQARKYCYHKLAEEGFTNTEIATAFNKDRSTVAKILGGISDAKNKSEEN